MSKKWNEYYYIFNNHPITNLYYQIQIHNGGSYDFNILLALALTHLSDYHITYQRSDGSTYKKPLFSGPPEILMKNQQQVLSVSFAFTCPEERCSHVLSPEQRANNTAAGKPNPHCPMRRKVRLIDTISFLPFSLSTIIEDCHNACEAENLQLSQVFSCSKEFCTSQSYSDDQFLSFIRHKLAMPYEMISSFEALESVKSPPDKSQFASTLRGSTGISDQEYNHFVSVWKSLNIENLTQVNIFAYRYSEK